MTVSVVIPTYNAEAYISPLLTQLEKQTVQPCEILIIDSSSEDGTLAAMKEHHNIRTITIQRSAYNHGGTRDLGVKQTNGDLILFMTQDAVPADNDLIKKLISLFPNHSEIAVAYARQIPRKDSSPREKLIRAYNYPEHSAVHSENDIPRLGIKTFFCSNVCAVYRRDLYERLGGFEKDLLSNEDMMYAAKAIRNGYQVAYAAEACVIHSHDLTCLEQYERNRIQGYEITRHRDLLGETSSSKEGLHMLKTVSFQLIQQGRILSLFGLFADCVSRYMGSRTGSKQYLREKNSKEGNR